MNNQGKITVFLSLTVGVFLVLGLTCIQVIDLYGARAKSAMCTRTAISDTQSNYNRYIFDRYHILLFDKTCGGYGEAYLEERLQKNLQDNLGESFSVRSVAVNGYRMIADGGCFYLKQQIADYMKYAALESGADAILRKTDGQDGTVSDSLLQTEGEEGDETAEGDFFEDVNDPRTLVSFFKGDFLMGAVMPADMKLKDYVLTDEDAWSARTTGVIGDFFCVDSKFDNYDSLKTDLLAGGGWSDSLIQAGMDVAYAGNVFNCATEQNVNDTAVLSCELEYLICGMPTDYSNLKGAVNRIIGLRMPVNYTFLMTNPEKKTVVAEIAAPLSLATLIPLPIMKRLLAGCWAYAEAITEVRHLLKGNRMSFAKNNGNWITDLDNLGDSLESNGITDENGLSYKDYLLILLAVRGDNSTYRMLDLMQLNARKEDDAFRIEHAAVGFTLDAQIEYDGKIIYIHESGGY